MLEDADTHVPLSIAFGAIGGVIAILDMPPRAADPCATYGPDTLSVGAAEANLLEHLERVAAQRYGEEGYGVDAERRRIPDQWHANPGRPAASSTPRASFTVDTDGVTLTRSPGFLAASFACDQQAARISSTVWMKRGTSNGLLM